MNFRENVRDLLDRNDMEQKELAAKTGISLHSLETYLRANASMPSADKAVRIAKALGVTVEYLVNGEDADRNKKYPAPSYEALKLHQFIERLNNVECKALLGLIKVIQGRESSV